MQEVADTPLAEREKIGPYRIVRPLSKGGMAAVYEGRREGLAGVSPRVAIKVILPEHNQSVTFRELFINEARLGAAMTHQNLVNIQAFDQDGDDYYIVMEYVEGHTLRRVISLCAKNDIPVPPWVVAEIGRQACEGLHYAHTARDEHGRPLKLVHRDIKPSNLILNPQGVMKILDFGISKGVLREEKSGQVKGTWGYMAPEQAFAQETRPSADLFGLAIVLYEMASRKPMFRGKKQEEIKRLLQDDHAARVCATLDPEYKDLLPVLVRALQRDPKARYLDAAQFGRALSSLLPDPVTTREHVVAFYDTIDALDKGRPVAMTRTGNTIPGTHDSSLAALPSVQEEEGASWGLLSALLVVFTALVVTAATVFGGLLVLGLTQIPSWSRATSARQEVTAPATAPYQAPLAEPGGPNSRPPPQGSQGAPEPVPEPAPVAEGPVPEPVIAPAPAPEVVSFKVDRRVQPEPAPQPGVPAQASDLFPAPAPAPKQIIVVPAPGPAPEATAQPDPNALPGKLQIGAEPPGTEVFIEGQFIRQTPLLKELAAGSYVVTLVAPDGRKKSFKVDVVAGEKIRKVWDFDRGTWR